LQDVLGSLRVSQEAPQKHLHLGAVRAVQRIKRAFVSPANALPNVAIVCQFSSPYCCSLWEAKIFIHYVVFFGLQKERCESERIRGLAPVPRRTAKAPSVAAREPWWASHLDQMNICEDFARCVLAVLFKRWCCLALSGKKPYLAILAQYGAGHGARVLRASGAGAMGD
jgi:hypothetical protein